MIAVHGIEISSPQTWTAYQSDTEPRGHAVNWLCDDDMLPTILLHTRIWTYVYNSNCYSDGAQEVDILGLGQVFLEILWSNGIDGLRPILFVGSCFGGIVVAQVSHAGILSHRYKDYL